MKKTVLKKESLREIWRSKNRFISIFAIVAIGVGFFAGVKAASPDMRMTMTNYFEQTRLADIHIASTYGLNEDDMLSIKDASDVSEVQGGYSAVMFVSEQGTQSATVQVLSLPDSTSETDLSQPVIKEGRLPQKSGECVVEKNIYTPKSFRLGGTVTLLPGDDNPVSDTLKTDTFTIVGIVESPQYIGFDRGKTKIGDGEIDTFMMIPEQDFSYVDDDIYTDAYILLKTTQGVSPFVPQYTTEANAVQANLEVIATKREQTRYDEIMNEANTKLADAKDELSTEKKKGEDELADAKAKIDDAESELADGKATLAKEKADFAKTMSDAQAKLDEAGRTLQSSEEQYGSGKAQYEDGLAKYNAALPQAQAQIAEYQKQADALSAQIAQLTQQKDGLGAAKSALDSVLAAYANAYAVDASSIPADVQAQIGAADTLTAILPDGTLPAGVTVSTLLTQYVLTDPTDAAAKQTLSGQLGGISAAADTAISGIADGIAQAQAGYDQLSAGLAQAKKQLADGKAALDTAALTLADSRRQLDNGWAEWNENKQKLADGKQTAQREFQKAQKKIDDGEQELADGKAEYQDGLNEFNEKIADAEQKISDAEQEIADIEKPVWYVWTREDNPGYASYQEDSEKVDAVAGVFPIFFILVAALVCLTTMTRMVEEQRTQIGTLKALGYTNGSIAGKYLFYAISASIGGSMVGLVIGFWLFPITIINAYRMRYFMPDPMTPFLWDYAVLCTAAAIACTAISAYVACRRELAECPAQLMRPKAPKPGKRVFMERIPFIWERLSFIRKVTVRNLFRYKKRLLMTVVGIAGCTALMLTGFGLQYSISAIVPKQFGEVFVYDLMGAMENNLPTETLTQDQAYISQTDGIQSSMLVLHKAGETTQGGAATSLNLFVPQQPSDISSYINLRTRVMQDPLTLTDGGVIINEKLSKLTGLKEGGTISFTDNDGNEYSAVITGVTENYAMNYVYMTPKLYEEITGKEADYNTFIANLTDGTDKKTLSAHLLDNENILGLSYSDESSVDFGNVIDSLGSIVFVLIVSAGALAIIVLYNLSNINITERIREIATIKVLGFYDKEASAYIYRENNISAIFGILAGLAMGVLLEKFVISTAEVDIVMFAPDIPLYCFLASAGLTAVFTLLVNFIMHFKIKKISMVESLKTIE